MERSEVNSTIGYSTMHVHQVDRYLIKETTKLSKTTSAEAHQNTKAIHPNLNEE